MPCHTSRLKARAIRITWNGLLDANGSSTKGIQNAPRHRKTLARKIGSAEKASRRQNHQRCDGRLQLRRGVRLGRLRGSTFAGLETKSLQTRYPGQVGHSPQKARIRDLSF